MPESDFTNREINAMFAGVMNKLDDHSVVHDKILSAVNTTNGKVADIQRWREQVNGGAKVAAFFMAMIVMPILGWSIFVLSQRENKIHDSIDEALSAYEIQYENNQKEN